MDNLFIYIFFYCLAEEDGRRPGQRPATSMLGNEVMSKEQLYDLYQQILGVKKFEHQLLYNAMQVTYVLLKVIHPKYYKHLKKGVYQSHLGRQKMGWFLAD